MKSQYLCIYIYIYMYSYVYIYIHAAEFCACALAAATPSILTCAVAPVILRVRAVAAVPPISRCAADAATHFAPANQRRRFLRCAAGAITRASAHLCIYIYIYIYINACFDRYFGTQFVLRKPYVNRNRTEIHIRPRNTHFA